MAEIGMPALAHLPVEVSIVTSILVLPALGEEHLWSHGVLVRDRPHLFSVLVAESIPPLP